MKSKRPFEGIFEGLSKAFKRPFEGLLKAFKRPFEAGLILRWSEWSVTGLLDHLMVLRGLITPLIKTAIRPPGGLIAC